MNAAVVVVAQFFDDIVRVDGSPSITKTAATNLIS
jgi:hypothetical protein